MKKLSVVLFMFILCFFFYRRLPEANPDLVDSEPKKNILLPGKRLKSVWQPMPAPSMVRHNMNPTHPARSLNDVSVLSCVADWQTAKKNIFVGSSILDDLDCLQDRGVITGLRQLLDDTTFILPEGPISVSRPKIVFQRMAAIDMLETVAADDGQYKIEAVQILEALVLRPIDHRLPVKIQRVLTAERHDGVLALMHIDPVRTVKTLTMKYGQEALSTYRVQLFNGVLNHGVKFGEVDRVLCGMADGSISELNEETKR